MNHDVKFLQIRDRGTNIPALAVNLNPKTLEDNGNGKREVAIVRRAGFRETIILLTKLETSESHYSAHSWPLGSRTMTQAHMFIQAQWAALKSGDVVCVETILGERETPKEFEA